MLPGLLVLFGASESTGVRGTALVSEESTFGGTLYSLALLRVEGLGTSDEITCAGVGEVSRPESESSTDPVSLGGL